MTGYVPVPWVSPLLYGAVLLGGLYYLAAGLGDGPGLLAWPISSPVSRPCRLWSGQDAAGACHDCLCCSRSVP
ncbi:hypothetical protein M2160_000403 [Streptomyces sp. SAI-117]|nr:hypothetical protein [Streptomyces sp. SAI-117]